MAEQQFFNELADIVRYHRKKSRLSRLELAHMAGVGKTVVYDIEHAKETVRFNILLKVLEILNISIKLKSPLMKIYEEDKK